MKTLYRINAFFLFFIFFMGLAQASKMTINHSLKNLGIATPLTFTKTKQGLGSIYGQLNNHSSGDILNDGTKFSVYLFKKHPRFGDWTLIDGVDSINGQYEFIDLEIGDYIVFADWRPADDPSTKYDNPFLSDFWSADGDYNCNPCEFKQTLTISLTEHEPSFQADFLLRKAAVIQVWLKTDEYDSISKAPPVYVLNKAGIKKGYQFLDYSGFINKIAPSPIEFFARFLLPEGEYRIYSESGRFKGRILGVDGYCQNCEYRVRAGEGQIFTLSENQLLYSPILYLDQPTGTISGSSETQSMKPNIMDFNKTNRFFKPPVITQNSDNEAYPYQFTLTGLDTGYYFLNFNNNTDPTNNPSDPNYFSYSTVYGDDYCDFPHCKYDQITPILVRDKKTTMLRPQNTAPKGGMIVGNIRDPLTQDNSILTDPGVQSTNVRDFWLSVFDENHQLITTNIVSESFRLTLPPGHYYLKTGHGQSGFSNRHYVNKLYPNHDCAGLYCDFSQGSLVEVKSGEETHINDIFLTRGLGIKGRVTNHETASGLQGVEVQVLDLNQHLVSSVLTDVDGFYSHWGLKPGEYYVRTQNGNLSTHEQYFIHKPYIGGFVNQLYPNTVCPNNQCDFSKVQPITLTSDDQNMVNFTLTSGHAFTGTVKDRQTDKTLINRRIKIFQTNGTQVGNHLTDQLGSFTTSALLPADYKILVEGGYLYLDNAVGNDDKDCLFDACELADAQNITLSSEPLNIQLTHKKDVLPHYTGMWFNPEESGHGLQFEVLDQDNAAILYVTWFAHVDGEPIWLTGSGPLLGDRAFVNLIITNGQDFPDSMNPEMWGELRVKFDSLNHASLSWTPQLEGFEVGELVVERLTIPTVPETDAYVNADLDIDACITGSYYDPERSGEGLQITALGDPVDYLSFNWYTYRDEQQFWFTGQGDVNQDQITSLAYYTHGTNFTPDFNPNHVETTAWGEVRIQKLPEDKLEIQFNPNTGHSDFDSRTVQLIRNSSPFPRLCGYQ